MSSLKKTNENVSIDKKICEKYTNDDFPNILGELDIRQIIKNTCKEKGVKAKDLCEGICAESYFSEFINKGKSIGKLMVSLFLQRLGLDDGSFEYYLSTEEYELANMRHNIVDMIEKKAIYEAENEIKTYESLTDKGDKLHKRFILLMKARLMQLNDEDAIKIYEKLKEAVEITVPNFEIKQSIEGLILGYNELFFIIECLNFREKMYSYKQPRDKLLQKLYYEIINYTEKIDFDGIIKARLYSKMSCIIAKKLLSRKKYKAVLENSDKAITYLQESAKLYSIEKILKNKSLAFEAIINSYENKKTMLENDMKQLDLYKDKYKENELQRKTICELFEKFNLSIEPYEWYPIDDDRELYSIGKIVRLRREMMNMTRAILSEDIFISEKTIARIERGEINPYLSSVKNIFERLGILGEFQIYVFDCKSYKEYKLEKSLSNLIVLGEYEKANEVLKKFKKSIDLSSRLNQQYLEHKETLIEHSLGSLTDEEAIERFTEALELTISIENIFSDTNKYFTKGEIGLINNISLIYKQRKDYKNAMKWLGLFENYYNNFQSDFDLRVYIITYEFTMRLYASLLGDMELYDKSDEIIQKTMYEALKCRRGRMIGRLIYSEAYNMKKRIEAEKIEMQPHEICLYKDKIERALIISNIINDNVMQEFLKNKLM